MRSPTYFEYFFDKIRSTGRRQKIKQIISVSEWFPQATEKTELKHSCWNVVLAPRTPTERHAAHPKAGRNNFDSSFFSFLGEFIDYGWRCDALSFQGYIKFVSVVWSDACRFALILHGHTHNDDVRLWLWVRSRVPSDVSKDLFAFMNTENEVNIFLHVWNGFNDWQRTTYVSYRWSFALYYLFTIVGVLRRLSHISLSRSYDSFMP